MIDDTYCEDKIFMGMYKGNFCPEEEKEAAIANCFDNALPALMKVLEPRLQDSGFLFGEKLTLADFIIGGFYTNMFANPKARFGVEDGKWAAFLAANPKFEAYGKRFAEANKDYLEKRFEASM